MAISPTLVWFRQDLRLKDNPALAAALSAVLSGSGVPSFWGQLDLFAGQLAPFVQASRDATSPEETTEAALRFLEAVRAVGLPLVRQVVQSRAFRVAAEVIGIRPLRTKLLAFAISSFYCGVAGALFAYAFLGTVEPEAFNLDLSFDHCPFVDEHGLRAMVKKAMRNSTLLAIAPTATISNICGVEECTQLSFDKVDRKSVV